MPGRAPGGWSRTIFWALSALLLGLWLSGWALYAWPADALPELGEAALAWRRAAVQVHGVAAWLLAVGLGRGVWPHARLMWARRTHLGPWLWGLLNLALLVFLALGGLALLYGSPDLHEGLAPWHFWAGALGPVLYLLHTARRRRRGHTGGGVGRPRP